MKKVILVVATVLILVIGIQQFSLAWGRGNMNGNGSAVAAACILDDKSLTQAQRTQIAALQQKHFDGMATLRQKTQESMLAYRQTRALNPDDSAALAAKRKAVEDARLAMQKKAAELRGEFAKILTPEQQAKLGQGLGRQGGQGRGMGRGCQGNGCGW